MLSWVSIGLPLVGTVQDHNMAKVPRDHQRFSLGLCRIISSNMAGRQILCRRLKFRTGYCKHESVPLCHDLLRFSPFVRAICVSLKQEHTLNKKNTLLLKSKSRGGRSGLNRVEAKPLNAIHFIKEKTFKLTKEKIHWCNPLYKGKDL